MQTDKLSTKSNNKVNYNDLSIRIVLSIVAAHVMTSYNEPEGFFEIILTSSYLRGFAGSFFIAFLTINYIYLLTLRLDHRYNWHRQTFLRFFWQLLLGLCVPAIIVFLLVALFFGIYNINIFETEYLSQDFPLVLLMLLVVNLYYFGLYHFLIAKNPIVLQPDKSNNEIAELQPISAEIQKEEEPSYKETIIITTPLKTFPIHTDEIAYIFRLSDGVFIRLKSMKDFGESYQTNYSLKDLEAMLDPSKFLRINRQMIVSYQSVKAFRNETAKTLLLTLDPEPYPIGKDTPPEHQKLMVVSETRTPRFKLWMDR